LKKTAHLTRGHLCLRLRRPEDAVVSFRRAVGLIDGPSSLDKSKKKIKSSTSNAPGGSMIGTHALVTPRAGLVASYLLQRRRKEALASAKEALACAPRSANAHALMGDAYLARGTMNAQVAVGFRTTADTKSRAEKAKKHFKTALQIDPGNARFALALSEACRLCGEADAAAACLRELLEGHAGGSNETNVRVACHCALGAVLASQRMLADAAGEYQKASGLDPDNDGARRGIARVERLMKGQDPDATEPDEDGDDDEDEDGEDEDGEDEDGDEEFE
jgi:anaphase-promoting complex subunit 7